MKRSDTSPIKWGIQKKLVTAILGAGIFFLFIGLYLTYTYVKGALTRTIGANFEEIAKKTAEGFDATVQKEIHAFQLLVSDPEFISALRQGNSSLLEQRLKPVLQNEQEPGTHLSVYALDNNGRVVAASRIRKEEPLFQGEMPWWNVIREKKKVYAGTIYRDPSTGRYAFDFAVPVLEGPEQTVVGAVKGVLDTEIFFRFIKEMRFARTGHGMLMSSDGTPLICSILPLVEHSMNRPLIEKIVQGGTGWTLAEDDAHGGKSSIVGFAPVRFLNSLGPESLGGQQWYAFIRQSPEETFEPVRQLLWKVLLFEAIVIGFVGFFGVFTARKFMLTPLEKLREGVRKVEQGEMDYRVDVRTDDEIQSLAEGFNRMSAALQESYAGLEQKIRDRTRELKTSETKYRALMEEAYDAIFLIHPQTGDLIEVNHQAEKMTGYTRQELLTLNIRDLPPDHEAEHAMEQFRKAVKRGHAVIHDALFRRKDGEILWVDIRARIIEYEGYKVYHSIVRDVTEQKKEEEKRRTANEQLSRSTLVMLEQDQKLTALRLEMSKLIRNSGLSDAEKEQALRTINST